MNAKEQQRAMVLNQVERRELTGQQAAVLVGLSLRQVRRLLARYRGEGVAALAHGNRGRAPVHRIAEQTRERVVELAQGPYKGLNHYHLQEMLAEREELVLSRSSLWRILAGARVASPRQRRAPQHRRRRERYPQEGMLLQVDGSRHDWLQGRGPYLSLVGAIDDATGTVPYALFRQQEDAQGYLLLLREIIHGKGMPLALYSDRHSIFQVNPQQGESLEDQLAGGRKPTTQVGRALQELGVQLICGPLPPGQRAHRTAVGHLSGPPGQRAAPGRGHHRGGGQPGAVGLLASFQRPLRRATSPARFSLSARGTRSVPRRGLVI